MSEESVDWIKRDQAVLWHGFTQMKTFADNEPLVVSHGQGNYLFDIEGNKYLDGISSLWVNTLGHQVPDLDQALIEQTGRVAHSTLLGNTNRTTIEFAESLSRVVPVDSPHILFASDGAAATEQALKIAFQYWHNLGQPKKSYLSLGGAYHGDTIGALSIGAGGFGTDLYNPLRFPVLRAPGYESRNWLDQAMELLEETADELAAVMIEPLVQGAAGIQVAEPGDVKKLVERAQGLGVPVICDEVATGFGRTGKLFASEICEISPDILCLGKGITGGYLALAATVVKERIYETFLGEDLGPETLYHGHSYSGNALACAVAQAHLELLEGSGILKELPGKAEHLKDQLTEALADCQQVKEIRQQGLMVGVELKPLSKGSHGRLVCKSAVRQGVLLRPLGDVVVLMPPLSITKDELVEIARVLANALEEVEAG